MARVRAGDIYTGSKELKFGTTEDENGPVGRGVGETQRHRGRGGSSCKKDCDKKGRQAWASLADGGGDDHTGKGRHGHGLATPQGDA